MPFGPDDPRNTPRCPGCDAGTGVPTSVEAGPGRLTVTFRCDRCGHSWNDERTVEKAQAKADFRSEDGTAKRMDAMSSS
jgi:hypothetical protein